MVTKKNSAKKGRDKSRVFGFSLSSLLDATEEELDPAADEFLTVSQAAELRGTSRVAVHELISRGRLKAVEIAGRKFVKRSDLAAFEPQKRGPKGEEE